MDIENGQNMEATDNAADTAAENQADAGTDASQAETGTDQNPPAQNDAQADNMPGEQQKNENDGQPGEMPAYSINVQGADAAIAGEFAKFAHGLGLNQQQANDLAKWQMDVIAKAREKMREDGRQILMKEWGQKSEANARQTLKLIAALDRQMDGKFSVALDAMGASDHPDIMAGLFRLSCLMEEDSLGLQIAAKPQKEETALEGLMDVWNKQRGKG